MRLAPQPSSRSFNASFDRRTPLRQFGAIAGESARELLFSRDFAVIAILLAIMVLALGTETISDDFRTPFWPLTQFIAEYLVSFLPALAMALLTTFYAGELVHRERSVGLAEIADANPVADWILYAGKFAALGLVLVTLQAILMASGLIAQLANGYFASRSASTCASSLVSSSRTTCSSPRWRCSSTFSSTTNTSATSSS